MGGLANVGTNVVEELKLIGMALVPGTPPGVGLPGISCSKHASSKRTKIVGLASVAGPSGVEVVKPPFVTLSNADRPLSLGGALGGRSPVDGSPVGESGAEGSPFGTACESSTSVGANSAVLMIVMS